MAELRARQAVAAAAVILAGKDAQIAAVIVGVLALMGVAEVALIGADWRGVGDAILARVIIFCSAIARAKEYTNDARVSKIGYMAQDILGAVILLVAGGIIFGIKILVAHRYLPHHDAQAGVGGERADKLEIAREVRQLCVGRVPPDARLPGVVVGHIIGEQVPVLDAAGIALNARRKQKVCFCLRDTAHVQASVGVAADVEP